MFSHRINERIELRLIHHPHCGELYQVLDANRLHLRPWHPWVDGIRSPADTERLITKWLTQFSANRGFHAGIWNEGTLCGIVNHLNIDWPNRSTALSYWLDESHQGRGIMTSACKELVGHAFKAYGLNRVTIECATANARSRRVPERLGFQLEGVIRGSEWLHDHFADHAVYGLLKSDWVEKPGTRVNDLPVAAPRSIACGVVSAGVLN